MAVQAPLQVYARMLAQKAQQQRALQRADAVQADMEDYMSSDDEELQAGSAGSARASADAGEALAASALPLAQKKAAKAIPARQQNPKVSSLRSLDCMLMSVQLECQNLCPAKH